MKMMMMIEKRQAVLNFWTLLISNWQSRKKAKALWKATRTITSYAILMVDKYLGRENSKIELNLFSYKKRYLNNLINTIKLKLNSPVKFRKINLQTLNRNNDLYYLVSKNIEKTEGLVGHCYSKSANTKEGEPVYYERNQHSDDNYNMNNYQRRDSNWVKFAICIPIGLNDGKIKYILNMETDIDTMSNDDKKGVENILDQYSMNIQTLFNALRI